MTEFHRIGAAVIGTGFIGTVHLEALRRLGVPVRGVLGSSPERAADRATALGVARAYRSLAELLEDPSVDVVHVTSPNVAHFDQVMQILAAGRHVVCEKPLAMTSAQSAEMVAAASITGKVAAVCYNTRFYPLNQHAHRMVADGALGEVRLVTGHYHQDWLVKPTDWNWRLETEEGGELRSVGDIGTHWMDLTSFITGQKVVSVMADLATFLPERQKPVGPVETFAAATGATQTRQIRTDDAATILLRFANGARGTVSTSQVSPGRKNSLVWDIAGSAASAAWNSETPDHLWIGHRDAPNQILQRDAALMNVAGAAAAALPGGHVEGFADTFRALFRQVYSDVALGARGPDATYAGFEDGHREMLFCDAVLKSARSGRWVDLDSL
ncbi:Gfo/Idh/MocA family oxidoreductase [Tabrizicola sp. J26]|uniref:Gfo/Idh/MocA family protein n=1 Tax=Alitabrizicola rongguiensis TaxID=2909234 RepID=UPI001F259D4C|nr:Gfo/Idh/MocA family oxidoreductase [Tabrizicola rongguiensis]MCF1710975.1 Gfo/Idh/MocA family oxidoreductase [Tabrizicola rongguiensis]